ncbi:MAG: acyltransferase family protein [Chthoniobacteraceae bacterium]
MPSTGEAIRIPALTGIRGVAVLLVMYLHFLPEAAWPQHAWIRRIFQTGLGSGVDLFFVLSGFLITGILLDTRASPHYFRNFFARRILRIFPLYYGVLAVIFGLLPALGMLGGAAFERVRELSGWHWAYLSNVAWLLHPSALDSPQIDLRHFWSLAVEEHFYLVWPFVIAWVSRRAVMRICAGLLLLSLTARLLSTRYGADFPNLVFLTPLHLDGLAAGSFMAALTRAPAWRNWLPATKVAFIAASLVLGGLLIALVGHPTLTHALGLALISGALACGVLLVLAAPGSNVSRMLSCRPLLFFGEYSYGLYVLHGLLAPTLSTWTPEGPWIAATGSGLIGCLLLASARIALVLPLAWISWHCYEGPILKLKRHFQ